MFKLSAHAKQRNLRRKIPLRRIKETVYKSQMIVKSGRKRKLRRRVYGNKILEVVTITEGSKITVITQYYLEPSYENKVRQSN